MKESPSTNGFLARCFPVHRDDQMAIFSDSRLDYDVVAIAGLPAMGPFDHPNFQGRTHMGNPLAGIGMDSNRYQFMARQRIESQINLPRLFAAIDADPDIVGQASCISMPIST